MGNVHSVGGLRGRGTEVLPFRFLRTWFVIIQVYIYGERIQNRSRIRSPLANLLLQQVGILHEADTRGSSTWHAGQSLGVTTGKQSPLLA